MWTDPNGTTPSIIQVDFGPWGQYIPGDGEAYCGPTSMVMGLYYLYANGFTQLAPGPFVSQTDPTTVNLELVVAGLCRTSTLGGTFTKGLKNGIANYLSARGISQYTYTSSDNPDITWLADQLAPNVAKTSSPIVLANFSVGWYYGTPPNLANTGGHVLAPLTADLTHGTVTLNNSYPASFEDVPNQPSENPQTVGIQPVPAGWTLPNLTNPQNPSQNYSQVISQTQGSGKSYAILWGGQTWAIDATALPSAPGYAPSVWQIDHAKRLNTNGGALTVIAPLAGGGGLQKWGLGTLTLTAANTLSGPNHVHRGVLESTITSGTPFGTGAMTLSGGGALAFNPGAAQAILFMASGSEATLTIGRGAAIQFIPFTGGGIFVTVGGSTDGATTNMNRTPGGSLIIAPGGGKLVLGWGQGLTVAGAGGNLPQVVNGAVAPYMVGQDWLTTKPGFFLTYSTEKPNSFVPASPNSSDNYPLNGAPPPPNAPYQAVSPQSINSGSTVTLSALEVDGVAISGDSGTTLQIGAQTAGSIAGLIMNGGSIGCGTLSFGAAEAAVYMGAAQGGAIISAEMSGSGGLTVFGPGSLTLQGAGSNLSGPVSVNSGTLIVAGTGATGSGSAFVNSGAMLEVTGSVAGAVHVAQAGTLFLNGGTVQGNLTTASVFDDTAAPGGALIGGGTVAGVAVINGVIGSGPAASLITFTNDVTISGAASFYWTLQSLVDNSHSAPGKGWNALVFESTENYTDATFYVDFSKLGSSPDGGDPFWSQSHTWTLINITTNEGSFHPQPGNFWYERGNFGLGWSWGKGRKQWSVFLTWTPASAPQSLAERRMAAAAARAAPPPGRPGA